MEKEDVNNNINISFAGILGNSATIKIIEHLIIGRNFRYHITDISRGSEISRSLCNKIVKDLVQRKIVKQIDKIGNIPRYQINKESKIVFYLIKCFNEVLKQNSK